MESRDKCQVSLKLINIIQIRTLIHALGFDCCRIESHRVGLALEASFLVSRRPGETETEIEEIEERPSLDSLCERD